MAEEIKKEEEQTEPENKQPEIKKESEDAPAWAKSLQETMQNLASSLTAAPAPKQEVKEIPAPTPPPEPEPEEEEEEEPEPPKKAANFLGWLW